MEFRKADTTIRYFDELFIGSMFIYKEHGNDIYMKIEPPNNDDDKNKDKNKTVFFIRMNFLRNYLPKLIKKSSDESYKFRFVKKITATQFTGSALNSWEKCEIRTYKIRRKSLQDSFFNILQKSR